MRYISLFRPVTYVQILHAVLCYKNLSLYQNKFRNADAMVLASALMRCIHPLDVRHFEYYQGGECLS
jgi:hypothetical protein